jgi:hypothetical protein
VQTAQRRKARATDAISPPRFIEAGETSTLGPELAGAAGTRFGACPSGRLGADCGGPTGESVAGSAVGSFAFSGGVVGAGAVADAVDVVGGTVRAWGCQ